MTFSQNQFICCIFFFSKSQKQKKMMDKINLVQPDPVKTNNSVIIREIKVHDFILQGKRHRKKIQSIKETLTFGRSCMWSPYLSFLITEVHARQNQPRTWMDDHRQTIVEVSHLNPPLWQLKRDKHTDRHWVDHTPRRRTQNNFVIRFSFKEEILDLTERPLSLSLTNNKN